ncbi:MAG: PD40 domain-containing protein [Armatimonadetes bacterium]|nr:PD40 domain-containing protein [Armatimonadota bacterium]
MTRRRALLLALAAALAVVAMRWPGPRPVGRVADLAQAPRLEPDLAGVVLPPNIAAPGLRIHEPGTAWHVALAGGRRAIWAAGRGRDVCFSPRSWRRLLAANRGRDLTLTVSVRQPSGQWARYQPLRLAVAAESVDRYLVYRLLTPGYNLVREVGCYQRDLTGYGERLVMSGHQVGGCVNCHCFWQGSGQRFTLQTRSTDFGPRTLVVDGRRVTALRQPAGHGTWHPGGKLAVYSVNQVRQMFHVASEETRDAFDLSSGLVLFDSERDQFSTTPALSSPDYLYTYPCWAPDGRTLYYCRAPRTWPSGELIPPPGYDQVRYDLCRITYDPGNGSWGQPETVLAARDTGRSQLFPRVSPDGRWLMFCECDYSCFPAYRRSSDLGLLDLTTGASVPVAINSDRSESWHGWSRNGRWVVFASKRADGLFTKLYLSYFDTAGRLHPALLLPQRRADYYDTLWYSYNVPELVDSRIRVSVGQLGRAARTDHAAPAPLPPEVAPPAPNLR